MYKQLFRQLLFKLDPESAHDIVHSLGKSVQAVPPLASLVRKSFRVHNQRLNQNIFGIDFENPVGLAAGFDKNAELIDFMYCLGFGFTEVGSVTAAHGSGNERPRMFRLPEEEAIVNHMGLNNHGANKVAEDLEYLRQRRLPVGINIAKTNNHQIMGDAAIADIVSAYDTLRLWANYLTLNISCPNTGEKTFEDPAVLKELLSELNLRDAVEPLLIKLSPDLARWELEGILDVCAQYDTLIHGYVVGNTTATQRDKLVYGGLSGKPLQQRALERVSLVHQLVPEKVIFGCGGIDSAESAYQILKAGASLVQLYTAMVYQGPGVVKEINQGLVQLMERDGIKNIREIVGKE